MAIGLSPSDIIGLTSPSRLSNAYQPQLEIFQRLLGVEAEAIQINDSPRPMGCATSQQQEARIKSLLDSIGFDISFED